MQLAPRPPPLRYSQRGYIADETWQAETVMNPTVWNRNEYLRRGMILGLGSYINSVRYMMNPLRWARLVLALLGRRGFEGYRDPI